MELQSTSYLEAGCLKRFAFHAGVAPDKKILIGCCYEIDSMPVKDKLVIWPIYFDSDRSRQDGRMVPLADAISKPNIDDIISAASKSGLKPEIEREKKHPKTWYHTSGRILVPK